AANQRVLEHFGLDEEIARRATVLARGALAGEPNFRAGVNAGGNLHRDRLGLFGDAGASADVADLPCLARAVARRAGADHLQRADLPARAAGAVAGRAAADGSASATAVAPLAAARARDRERALGA